MQAKALVTVSVATSAEILLVMLKKFKGKKKSQLARVVADFQTISSKYLVLHAFTLTFLKKKFNKYLYGIKKVCVIASRNKKNILRFAL